MPKLYGPSWPRRVDRRATRGPYEPHDEPPLVSPARTLGEALQDYGRQMQVVITPYDGSNPAVPLGPGEAPKYFVYRLCDGSFRLVDVHVQRAGEWVCPKQNLAFEVSDADEIEIGELIC